MTNPRWVALLLGLLMIVPGTVPVSALLVAVR